MNKNSKIYVAGYRGLVGSAVFRALKKEGFINVLTSDKQSLDLCNQKLVDEFFANNKPEYVFMCAAKVGGIMATQTYPVEFGYINSIIQANVMNAAHRNNVKKLLFLGSNCIYPKNCQQPIKEEYLLSHELEKTNEIYALAKILGVKMCQAYREQYNMDFISCMPCNLYGIEDNFNYQNSHLIPALIRKIHDAKINKEKTISIWGTGVARREVLFSDDMADACIFLMNNYNDKQPINIGTGVDYSMGELYTIISKIIGYKGSFVFDSSKPDGTVKKLLDVSKINSLGWKFRYALEDGIQITYKWFLANQKNIRM